MKRMKFDSNGKLIGVDGSLENYQKKEKVGSENRELRTSSSLLFLQKDSDKGDKMEDIFEKDYWSLHGKQALKPLKFTNGKTQEDVVREIVELIQKGTRIVFLHGTCGTGKSAIALNIARSLGSASVVVPVKALQKQYEEDYMHKLHLRNKSGRKMKIAMITGRDNHDSLYFPGKSCADPLLPENIKLTDKNQDKLMEYYSSNPLLQNKDFPDIQDLKRISIAPTNPYWSPILPADLDLRQMKANKMKYKGCDGKQYIFYHRKPGCSYYDQYLSYKEADVIIFNSAKYLAELSLGRKPMTDVEIIDEADDFLDSLFEQGEINLNRLENSLKHIVPDKPETREHLKRILELLGLEIKNKIVLGVDEEQVFHIRETKIADILGMLIGDSDLEAEILIDEMNYANSALEAAKNFGNTLDDVYVTFRKEEDNHFVRLVSINLTPKFSDLLNKTKSLVFMSGTLHSPRIIKELFRLEDYKIVEAETITMGQLDIVKTGKEFDCKYSNFSSNRKSRQDYLESLKACIIKAEKPTLIHVNAFRDLPNEEEIAKFDLYGVMNHEKLIQLQRDDKEGRAIIGFKQGLSERLFSTKCSRGVDFPGDTCKSIVFTKYPNPNVKDTFWKILQKTNPGIYWEFYRDKARREFIQRIFRALRSPEDHVFILSPDTRVLDAVREMQEQSIN
ncbi:hypothetical protein COU62_02320 [Candidatus Pacearchaeota archaeon CG10_big_fil_rev_8_21_14_0_10_35_219]|nr:DEAD/DEAH box helicase family protein [Candidatus Pacearchaeota archaeon]OIO41977.1 MAG: hypothetical protein AUJ63_04460 [Candidatus Pacearchaeota archaeon CG1_02_35_32]PIO07804.1 MAG: hypothetical protein COU62_02320 [Candidatus Pacearchaeota archaeon CG10_big_fil_rev_8_21_14_0_10_35_219]PIY81026.1 MAG: hypothetical protein COY79_04430 [Candidatus Pacearchaeota archaeon CG_4_10_14_0_8_um_filter_35_169]PIZ79895.1 MAG: hypothetical protein COY00_02735 [Candidatus Pacearchaeota archaeon CG_4_